MNEKARLEINERTVCKISITRWKNIFDPQRVDSFTREVKMEEIHLTTMLKENICGKFKAKSCADVRKQQRYFSKEEEVSPTI